MGVSRDVCVPGLPEREFFIDNLLVRIRFIIEMIRWTGLASRDVCVPELPGYGVMV